MAKLLETLWKCGPCEICYGTQKVMMMGFALTQHFSELKC